MSDPITLDLLAAQQQRILDELTAMRGQFALMQDDIRALAAMAIRQDTATRSTRDLLGRPIDRVARREDAAHAT